jgi:hypothetical protein
MGQPFEFQGPAVESRFCVQKSADGKTLVVMLGEYPIVTLVRWPLKLEPRYR